MEVHFLFCLVITLMAGLFQQNLDLLKVVQSEVQTCVTELDKLKKVYVDDEHVSHDARDKAREAEEK